MQERESPQCGTVIGINRSTGGEAVASRRSADSSLCARIADLQRRCSLPSLAVCRPLTDLPPVQYTFNCGTMELAGKTVTADKRKGKVVLSMEDDGLLRFQWRLRHSDNNEQQFFVSGNAQHAQAEKGDAGPLGALS